MIKAKFGDSLRSKTDTAMINEALAKVLCHNICCLIQSHYELGIEATFWGKEDPCPRMRLSRLKPIRSRRILGYNQLQNYLVGISTLMNINAYKILIVLRIWFSFLC